MEICVRPTSKNCYFFFANIAEVDHYEFFPYQYGAFSLISYYDKRKLTKRKVLADTDNFVIRSNKSFFSDLRKKDAIVLRFNLQKERAKCVAMN